MAASKRTGKSSHVEVMAQQRSGQLRFIGTRVLVHHMIVLLIVAAFIFASALLVVMTTHHYRAFYDQYQRLVSERDQLNTEWSQLILEQGALSSSSRIEKIAVEQLGMAVPEIASVRMVLSER